MYFVRKYRINIVITYTLKRQTKIKSYPNLLLWQGSLLDIVGDLLSIPPLTKMCFMQTHFFSAKKIYSFKEAKNKVLEFPKKTSKKFCDLYKIKLIFVSRKTFD